MTTADHFLELSIPTRDIQESLAFYRLLGFGELETGEIRTYYYAVVTDGKIALGLHGSGPEEPAIAFVRSNLANHIPELEESGVHFAFQELGMDQFHEVGFYSPDGQLVRMLEARTFSPAAPDTLPASVIGQTLEISLRIRDFAAAVAFWEKCGFIVDADHDDYAGCGHVRLLAPGITLGLRDNLRWSEPTLRFEPENIASVLERLEQKGIQARPSGDGFAISAPEGTRLMLIEHKADNATQS